MQAADPLDLQRFVAAQDSAIADVRDELAHGRKRSHWMWFVFPQLKGLGMSSTAQFYGLGSLEEAQAYLAHPVLGPRLVECCELMLQVPGRSAHDILGSPDDLKFRSCATLFGLAAPQEKVFSECLEKFYAGEQDPKTLELLGAV
ncbi:DUF1810 domain-containing protein [Ramlibacter sp. G-1-2-2]|uniref:DUF1810 domain-containing protein n=1 Tax=Ramlibacter agri TaxID=2728837 RepID=A0A848H622_9BURK|nr:DUF1810 domain-containing protein [Ramlibacter agri]NML46406.1 DUF1810 domain-containing protein [Ramlibacter agri]